MGNVNITIFEPAAINTQIQYDYKQPSPKKLNQKHAKT